jgi:MSHA biogenesis protein MshE
MDASETKIAKFLLDTGLLDNFQYQSAKDHLSQYGGKFHLVVLELGLVPEERMVTVISKVIGLPKISLETQRTDPQALKKLPADFCLERLVYPSAVIEGGTALRLAMADPTDVTTRSQAQVRSGLKIRPVVAGVSEVREAIQRDYALDEKKEAFVVGTIDLSLSDEEAASGEFKVTDLAGKTRVKHSAPKGTAKSAAEVKTEAPPGDSQPSLTVRLDKLIEGQDRFEKIMKGVIELCVEKGFFNPAEIQDRMKKK